MLRIIIELLEFLPFAVDAVPCRIAFERGKERHFCFLPISLGMSGWVVLAEELPLKQHYGVVRVAAPLAGSNVCTLWFFFLPLYVVHDESCALLLLLKSVREASNKL